AGLASAGEGRPRGAARGRCRGRIGPGAFQPARPDPHGHPAARDGRTGGDGPAEAGSAHRRHSHYRADRDGDERGRGKDQGGRLRRVYRQTPALPGIVRGDRHPVAQAGTAGGRRIESSSSGAMSSPATILIVDDEIQNRKLLEVLLVPEGYLTASAANGEEALASVAEHAPDLILLDILMPGMDGYQVARTLKANPVSSNIPIIMLTVQIDRDARLAGLNAGAEEFLTKPVDRDELSLRV